MSHLLRREWDYIILVPDVPGDTQELLPILYLLHGADGCAQDFVDQGNLQATYDRLLDHLRIEPALLVMPNGFASWYVDYDDFPMQRAFFEELIPHVERTFGIRASREKRTIAGLSMGGYGALRFALLRPALFNDVALMSPAVYHDLPPENSSARLDPPFRTAGIFDPSKWRKCIYTNLLADYLANEDRLKFHVASGAEDEYGIACEALTLFRQLRLSEQQAVLHLAPGAHDWTTWITAIEVALIFLLDPLRPAIATQLQQSASNPQA